MICLAIVLFFLNAVEPKLDFDSAASIDNIDNLVQYEYQYQVDESRRRGPVMDRWERRLGEYVKGAYSVLQPDGSVRTVDYEVDGDRGYQAVTRLSPPTSEYLSSQQLRQSHEMFPAAALPALTAPENQSLEETPLTASSEKIINFHAKPPYINKREFKDHKAAASTNVVTAAFQGGLPLTPANYNVPQPQKLIYYKTPAGEIQPNLQLPKNIFNIDAILPSQRNTLDFVYTNGITETVSKTRKRSYSTRQDSFSKPVKRYSKLVKRYNSFDDVFL